MIKFKKLSFFVTLRHFIGRKEVLADADENEKWTDEEQADSEVEGDKDGEGSLTVRNLHLLNKKAQRNQQKLENLFIAGAYIVKTTSVVNTERVVVKV